MQQITLDTKVYEKKEGFKNAYKLVNHTNNIVTEKEHRLITNDDTCKWFRRLGGSETVTRAYTCAGYVPVKLISTSPDKNIKKVREFRFKWID